jgi:hypothetical protein
MKTFLKNIWIVAILALVAASCTSETPATPEPEVSTNRVHLKITQGGVDTKAGVEPASPVANETELAVDGTGYIFFINASGIITRYVEIGGQGGVPYNLLTSTDEGCTISDVPSASTKVFIILNSASGSVQSITNAAWTSASIVGRQFSTVANLLIKAQELGSGISNIPVTGEGTITGSYIPHTGNYMRATVECRPVASRIEIEKIKAVESPSTGTTVKSFRLTGIFINTFIREVPIANITSQALQLNFVSGATAALLLEAPYSDYANLYSHVEDFSTEELNTENDATGRYVENKVWAYNVFPHPRPSESSAMPKVVIRLDDITVQYSDETTYEYTEPQFVTVNGYVESENELTNFDRGVIYSISSLEFSADNLSPKPGGSNSAKARVKATLIPWQKKEVTPIF